MRARPSLFDRLSDDLSPVQLNTLQLLSLCSENRIRAEESRAQLDANRRPTDPSASLQSPPGESRYVEHACRMPSGKDDTDVQIIFEPLLRGF